MPRRSRRTKPLAALGRIAAAAPAHRLLVAASSQPQQQLAAVARARARSTPVVGRKIPYHYSYRTTVLPVKRIKCAS